MDSKSPEHPYDMNASGEHVSPFVRNKDEEKEGIEKVASVPPPVWRSFLRSEEVGATGPSYTTWTRKQVVPCLLLYAGMVAQLICMMMVGPGLLDLQLVTDTSIEQASWFLSARAMGALLGSLLLSKTLEMTYRWEQMCSALILSGLAFGIIPWVSNFPAVIILFVLTGAGMGYFLTGAMLSLFSIWDSKKDGVSWLNGGQLMLVVGGIIGPLIVRPFFATPVPTNSTQPEPPGKRDKPEFDDLFPFPQPDATALPEGSQTYIMYAFLIGAAAVVLTGILSLVTNTAMGGFRFEIRNPMAGATATAKRLFLLKGGIMVVLFLFHVVTSVLVRTFASYITVFTVNYMGWTKGMGSLLTSVVFIAAIFAKIACIFLVRVFRTEVQLFAGLVINIIGAVTLLFLIDYADWLLWVCTMVIALGDANITATILAWTDAYVGIKGIVGALYNIGGTVGEIVAAPLVGWLFAEVSYVSFLYLLAISSIVNLIFMLFLQAMGMRYKYLVEHGPPNENTPLVTDRK